MSRIASSQEYCQGWKEFRQAYTENQALIVKLVPEINEQSKWVDKNKKTASRATVSVETQSPALVKECGRVGRQGHARFLTYYTRHLQLGLDI